MNDKRSNENSAPFTIIITIISHSWTHISIFHTIPFAVGAILVAAMQATKMIFEKKMHSSVRNN